MQEINQNIYYEHGYAGVTLGAMLLPRGVVLIDAPLRVDDSHTWNASILSHINRDDEKEQKETTSDHILIYLDAHPDRTIGARVLETTSQIPTIIAHWDTARGFDDRPTIFKGQNGDTGAEWEECDDMVSTRWALPDLMFTNQMSLFWEQRINRRNTEPTTSSRYISLEYHPGPAEGSIWVHIPHAKVLFIGDAVVVDQPPFFETSDITAWLKTLDELASSKYRGYSIISGRGGLVGEKDILSQKMYLERTQKMLRGLEEKGIKLQDIDKMVPDLLSRLNYPAKRSSLYEQRLRFGLGQYLIRHKLVESYIE